MRVIKVGNPVKAWPREHKVPCCDSVLELEPADILQNRDYTGSHSSWFINCPVCGGQPDVPDEMKWDANRWKAQQERIGL